MTQQGGSPPRIGVDIGGTFTDVVLEKGTARYTAKVLTTPRAPEQGVGQGIQGVLADSGVAPGGRADHPWHDARHQRSD